SRVGGGGGGVAVRPGGSGTMAEPAGRILTGGFLRVVALSCALAAFGCRDHSDPAPRAGSVQAEDQIALDAAHAGRETVRVERADPPELIAAMGRVLDPVPLLQAWTAYSSARAESDAVERDLERVRALSVHAENASARELDAAETAAGRARAALL